MCKLRSPFLGGSIVTNFKNLSCGLTFVIVCLLAVSTAQGAVYYHFQGLEDVPNSTVDMAAAIDQIFVEVFDGSEGKANFRFHNVGSVDCSIVDVYFDVGNSLAPPMTITDSLGVAFSEDAAPGSPPGWGGSVAAGVYSGDSDSPIVANGVNNTLADVEWVNFNFALATGTTFDDVKDNLGTDVQIAIHVQGFDDGESEWLILEPTPFIPPWGQGSPVPEPTALAIWGAFAGLGLMVGRQRQKRLG